MNCWTGWARLHELDFCAVAQTWSGEKGWEHKSVPPLLYVINLLLLKMSTYCSMILNERLKPFSSNILLHDWSRLLARCIKFGLWTDIPWRSDLQSSLAKWLAEYRGHALHPGAAENAAGGETAEMIVMPVLISRIKIAMGESEIGDISKDPQRSTAPGLVLQLEQPPRQHHPLLPLSPGASGSEALLRSSAMSVEVRSSTSHHPCHAD